MDNSIELIGTIAKAPYILCKDEETAILIRATIQKDYAKIPPVIVAENWDDTWDYTAVVVTPLVILGTGQRSSFTIDADIPANARKVLNAYIMLQIARDGGSVGYRDIATASGLSRRQVEYAVRELVKRNLVRKTSDGSFSACIGSWRPDPAKARALGVEITEY